MVTPFQKFRAQYPESALVADLISIYDDRYVVRASILLKGEAVATGLATDQSVEAAEDRARDRALAILGFSESQRPGAQVLANTAEVPKAQTNNEPSSADDLTFTPTEVLEPEEPEDPEEPEEDLGPPIEMVAEQSLPTSDQKPSAAAIALENFNTSALPVDLSDVIAQTDVELRRLGWTSAQGQEYLEKTYGKRSRRQLTDDELMSFLLYLEDQ